MADEADIPEFWKLNYIGDLTLFQHPPCMFLLWWLGLAVNAIWPTLKEYIDKILNSEGGGSDSGGGEKQDEGEGEDGGEGEAEGEETAAEQQGETTEGGAEETDNPPEAEEGGEEPTEEEAEG